MDLKVDTVETGLPADEKGLLALNRILDVSYSLPFVSLLRYFVRRALISSTQ